MADAQKEKAPPSAPLRWDPARWPLLVLGLLFWSLASWPPASAAPWQDILAGLAAVCLVTFVMKDVVPTPGSVRKWLEPARYFWCLLYIFVLAYYVVRANLDVVYRVLHPDMPIWPGIVRVRTELKSPLAVAVLANSITLTPGTLTVNATTDGVLYVHWITVRAQDDAAAAACVTQRFEWYIRKIFE